MIAQREARLAEVRAFGEGDIDAFIEGGQRHRWRFGTIGRLELDAPLPSVEERQDQTAQGIGALENRVLGDQHFRLAIGDARLRRHHLDLCEDAGFDFDPIDLQQTLRHFEGAALHVEIVDGENVLPVGPFGIEDLVDHFLPITLTRHALGVTRLNDRGLIVLEPRLPKDRLGEGSGRRRRETRVYETTRFAITEVRRHLKLPGRSCREHPLHPRRQIQDIGTVGDDGLENSGEPSALKLPVGKI